LVILVCVSTCSTLTVTVYLCLLMENNMYTARCSYRWVYFPRRKDNVRDLPEELLVQKK
jgi:hypothetical protein